MSERERASQNSPGFRSALVKSGCVGVWRGRQVEEAKANIINSKVTEATRSMYKDDIAANPLHKSQYVDLFNSKELSDDPVSRAALAKMMTPETLQYAHELLGDEPFYVRRDMLNSALGYPKASVGDAWTGTSRWSPEVQEGVKNLAISVLGNHAYSTLVRSENIVHEVVKNVASLILVKSMIVPASNFVSNIYQLMSSGVPIAHILKAMPQKMAEINDYAKTRVEEMTLNAELQASPAGSDQRAKLVAQIQSMQDGYRRLGIYPLIEAGHFSGLSDVGAARDYIHLGEGKLQSYIKGVTSKLPKAVQTAGRYALITKNTALYEGLARATDYGDMLAKAILYDDAIGRQKQSPTDALNKVSDEFVNYDLLPGRFRSYFNDMGLLWFFNFKIRAAKIAASSLRNNPVRSVLASLIPAPPGIHAGTPLDDNRFGAGVMAVGQSNLSVDDPASSEITSMSRP